MSQEKQQPAGETEEALDITFDEVDAVGSAADQPLVFIRLDATVRQHMIDHADSDTSRELGGVLLGRLKEGEQPVVTVEAAIPAKYTDAMQASITFTHQTWADIHEVKDRNYPNLKIVGWYHTHPGFGVFLSRFDLHIHQNFFDLPWQIAYVVDPLAKTEGFFRWEAGKVQKSADYEVFGALPAPITVRARRSEFAEPRNYLIFVLAACLAYLILFKPPLVAPSVPKLPPLKPLPPPVTIAPPVQPPAKLGWLDYTVQRGDTLWEISLQFYGEEQMWRGLQMIKIANNLAGDRIVTGSHLKIPGPLHVPDPPATGEVP